MIKWALHYIHHIKPKYIILKTIYTVLKIRLSAIKFGKINKKPCETKMFCPLFKCLAGDTGQPVTLDDVVESMKCNYSNRWMLSFSSILNEIVKVQLRPYTTVKLMLKTFDIQAFADPRHHQG